MKTLTADFDVAHKMRPDMPEECLVAMGRRFWQNHFFLRIETLTGLADWYYNLSREEVREIYKGYKKELQMIGYKGD